MNNRSLAERKYYPFLDGFRAIAIIWVLLYHVNRFFEPGKLYGAFARSPLSKIISSGFLGVDIFFVISGFLITGLLINDLENKVRIERFYARRFFKIIPHYFGAVITGLIITAVFDPKFLIGWKTIGGYFFFYNNYTPRIPILAHMWSIAIEEHFYLVLPLLMSFVCLIRKDPQARKKMLFIFFSSSPFLVGKFRSLG